MEEYFVNRENEVKAFREALENLYKSTCRPQVLLFHGASGMGKTWLTNRCLDIAKHHQKCPLTLYVDCNRTDMNLEKVFNEIHLQLEPDFETQFEEYTKFLTEINDIENDVDAEATSSPENAQKLASVISAVSSKVIADTVPGANTLIGEKNIQTVTNLATQGVAQSITKFRQKLAKKKLKEKKLRLFLKDLQAEQAKKLARILNKIAEDKDRPIVLLIDRFERLATSINERSDTTFYEYWQRYFVNFLSDKILLVQNGRLNLEGDYQVRLTRHRVQGFELKKFAEKDIGRILSQLTLLKEQMKEYEKFVQFVFKTTQGYPVAVGMLKGHFQSIQTIEECERLQEEILHKEVDIVENSINRFLDNNTNPENRETVYKLAICCTSAGLIEQKAIKYILQNTDMSFPQVEYELKKLSQQYSFIDATRWTMHELARIFILRYIKYHDPEYIKKINRELREFYTEQANQTGKGAEA